MTEKKLTDVFNNEEILNALLSGLQKLQEQLTRLHKRVLELEEDKE